MDAVGKKISETRRLKGFTQEELAELSKVNLRTIQGIENRKNEPRGKTLSLICDVLQIDKAELQELNKLTQNKTIGVFVVNGVFLILLNLLLMFIIVTFNSYISFFQLSEDKELTEKINLKYLKEKKPIDLTKITDFKWDNYIVIGPYQIPQEVGRKFKVDLSNISDYETADDSKSFLIFLKNKKSIKICTIRAKFGENQLLKIK